MSQNDPSRITQEVRQEDGSIREVKSEYILKDPHIKSHIDYVDAISHENFWKCVKIGLFSMVLFMGFFIYGGYLKSRKKLERGNQIVSVNQLKGILKRTGEASDLHLRTSFSQRQRNLSYPDYRYNELWKNKLFSYPSTSDSKSV